MLFPLLPDKTPKIPAFVECFALCLNADGYTPETDFISAGHLYFVLGFVRSAAFFPYGVRLADRNRNALAQAFYLQHFDYFFHFLN